MSQLTIDRILETLGQALGSTLPGLKAQMTMAPAHRAELVRESQPGPETREAAVLVAITDHQTPKVVLTQRRSNLKYHPGQISFPGGRREPEEELLQTALRETYEEVGLPVECVKVLGRLSPLFVPPSGFRVYPFVGIVDGHPTLSPADEEVSRIILADLHRLCDPEARASETRTIRGREVEVPYFALDGYKIWGATAMMMAELIELLDA